MFLQGRQLSNPQSNKADRVRVRVRVRARAKVRIGVWLMSFSLFLAAEI